MVKERGNKPGTNADDGGTPECPRQTEGGGNKHTWGRSKSQCSTGLPVNLNSTKCPVLHNFIPVVLQQRCINVFAHHTSFEGFLQICTFQNKSDANEMQQQTHCSAALVQRTESRQQQQHRAVCWPTLWVRVLGAMDTNLLHFIK